MSNITSSWKVNFNLTFEVGSRPHSDLLAHACGLNPLYEKFSVAKKCF